MKFVIIISVVLAGLWIIYEAAKDFKANDAYGSPYGFDGYA